MRLPRYCLGAAALALVVSLLLVAGCDGFVYATHAIGGELAIQGETEPIDDVLASGRLSEEEEEKLRLIVKAREFAATEIGLDAHNAYTTFYDTEGDPLAFNLSAARRDALVPQTWRFPLVGEIPYLGFFDEQYMREVEEDLIADGLDTFTYELDAYSTLGLLEDPVRSTMLKRGKLSLAETIIHELLHNTIWRQNETVFNESLATFVGRKGAVQFLQAEFGADSGWAELAVGYYADLDAVNRFLFDLYNDLAAYYGQPLTPEEKTAGREAVYQAGRDRFVSEVQPVLNYPDTFAGYGDLPTNNAWMLGHYRYNLDLEVFEAVYEAVGQDWSAALDVYRAAAVARGDPFEYLHDWLARHAR
jgi:predicted aminopeptidase